MAVSPFLLLEMVIFSFDWDVTPKFDFAEMLAKFCFSSFLSTSPSLTLDLSEQSRKELRLPRDHPSVLSASGHASETFHPLISRGCGQSYLKIH